MGKEKKSGSKSETLKALEIKELDTELAKSYFCGSCSQGFDNESEYRDHTNEEEHNYHIERRILQMVPGLGFCPACSCLVQTAKAWDSHAMTDKHTLCIRTLNSAGIFGEFNQPLGCTVPGQLGLPISKHEIDHKKSNLYGHGHGGKMSKATPVIGLNMVILVSENYYYCGTCYENFTFEHRSRHLGGQSHRIHYIKTSYPAWYEDISKIPEERVMRRQFKLMFYAHQIERIELSSESEVAKAMRIKFFAEATQRLTKNIGKPKRRYDGKDDSSWNNNTSNNTENSSKGARKDGNKNNNSNQNRKSNNNHRTSMPGFVKDSLDSNKTDHKPRSQKKQPKRLGRSCLMKKPLKTIEDENGPTSWADLAESGGPSCWGDIAKLTNDSETPIGKKPSGGRYDAFVGEPKPELKRPATENIAYPPLSHPAREVKKHRPSPAGYQNPYASVGDINQLNKANAYEPEDPYAAEEEKEKAMKAIDDLEKLAMDKAKETVKEKMETLKKKITVSDGSISDGFIPRGPIHRDFRVPRSRGPMSDEFGEHTGPRPPIVRGPLSDGYSEFDRPRGPRDVKFDGPRDTMPIGMNCGSFGGPRAPRPDKFGGPRGSRSNSFGGPRGPRPDGFCGPRGTRPDGFGGPRGIRPDGYGGPRGPRTVGFGGPRGPRQDGFGGPRGPHPVGFVGPRGSRPDGFGRPRGPRPTYPVSTMPRGGIRKHLVH